eukprot:jgi/Tetstr1/457152/TSEL_043802.t1
MYGHVMEMRVPLHLPQPVADGTLHYMSYEGDVHRPFNLEHHPGKIAKEANKKHTKEHMASTINMFGVHDEELAEYGKVMPVCERCMEEGCKIPLKMSKANGKVKAAAKAKEAACGAHRAKRAKAT